ncbi:MAG: hypothetical protein ACREDG_09605, partial [Methylocella sp.]
MIIKLSSFCPSEMRVPPVQIRTKQIQVKFFGFDYFVAHATSYTMGSRGRQPFRRHPFGFGKVSHKAPLDHDDFGLNQSKIMNVIDSKSLERDAGGKPV